MCQEATRKGQKIVGRLLGALFIVARSTCLTLRGSGIIVCRGSRALTGIPLQSVRKVVYFSCGNTSPTLVKHYNGLNISVTFCSPENRCCYSILKRRGHGILLHHRRFQITSSRRGSLHCTGSFVINGLCGTG